MTNTTNIPTPINVCIDRTDLDLFIELVEYGAGKCKSELLGGYQDEVNNLTTGHMGDYVDLAGNFKDLMDQIDSLERRVLAQLRPG